MINVQLFRKNVPFCSFNINISHIREKNTYVDGVNGKPIRVFNQFGGYTIGAYSLPICDQDLGPHCHNRIVISRCSPKDNYDRHLGIMCCIEKVVEKLWPEEGFNLVPILTENNRLISADKVIKINLV